MALGPHGLGVVQDVEVATRLGEYGVLLLLFFIGMEISLPQLVAGWRVSVVGTVLQVTLSVVIATVAGHFLAWPFSRSLLLGFVTSLSSTSVVLELLRHRQETDTPVGQAAIRILLVQDVMVVPMMIVLGLVGGAQISSLEVSMQIAGGLAVVMLVLYLARGNTIRLPLGRMRDDPEIQVFAALALCFGFAAALGLLHLSAPLGAFVAGLVVAAAQQAHWFHDRLDSFRTVLVAIFFVSVGLIVDLRYLSEHSAVVLGCVAVALLGNTVLNSLILKALRRPWDESLRTGALLAPIGEFSFVLAAVGLSSGLVGQSGYQATLLIIFLTLLAAPLWQRPFRQMSSLAEGRN